MVAHPLIIRSVPPGPATRVYGWGGQLLIGPAEDAPLGIYKLVLNMPEIVASKLIVSEDLFVLNPPSPPHPLTLTVAAFPPPATQPHWRQ